MRYFHRTPVPIDEALDLADRYFGERLGSRDAEGRTRRYAGTVGRVTVSVRAEGGHYTLVTLATDNVGESEIDKLAKRFLTTLHARAHASHHLRGAY